VDDLLTTRQLQDLLRVDRITIYRMLKDGRLRGFKVGGQWRLSRGEIEIWLQEQQSRARWAAGPTRPAYVGAGRLSLNRANNPEPVTLHDSCNLGRKGGLVEEPRRVVRAAAEDFREMTPNCERSFCCGVGSGLAAMPEWEDMRLKAGGPKVEQVHATGASVVIASCDNCRHQFLELDEHYDLNVQVMGLTELVVQALVPNSPA
jgi:excisionase family DNA binding protein